MALPFQNILLFEDEVSRSRRFLPLTYTRSVAELRAGALTGIERLQALIAANFPDVRLYLHAAGHLQNVIRSRYQLPVNDIPEGATVLVNARSMFGGIERVFEIHELGDSVRDQILSGEPLDGSKTSSKIRSLWDLIHHNPKLIVQDLELLLSVGSVQRVNESAYRGVMLAGDVYAHPSTKIGLGVVLDATDGPIIIMEGARIMPQATIMGPAVIGKDSIVKVGAKIYEGTTIGPVCKVGGEIENSIFQGYSNKQHDGYVGHSFLGEWCNLGADTNTSDLKNDYSNVRVTIEGEEFDTESLFVGLLMGDHAKSAINTQFNTGTAVGVSCNVFDAGFPPKWIPNFSWGGASGFTTYRFEKAIHVARTVTARRKVTLSSEEEAVLRRLFNERTQTNV